MPIYEYVCRACGHEFETMQKAQDSPLKKCPHCGRSKLQKQISSTSFQLKGKGWYVTDFRDKGKPKDGGGHKNQREAEGSEAVAKEETKSAQKDGTSNSTQQTATQTTQTAVTTD
jgi:putative FmdB family regulatory protein